MCCCNPSKHTFKADVGSGEEMCNFQLNPARAFIAVTDITLILIVSSEYMQLFEQNENKCLTESTVFIRL